jgi:hypothetical protein
LALGAEESSGCTDQVSLVALFKMQAAQAGRLRPSARRRNPNA